MKVGSIIFNSCYLGYFDHQWAKIGRAGQKVSFVFSFLVLFKEMTTWV